MPMYFFLTHLSLVDLCYTSTAAPQMLTNLVSQKKTISFAGCFAQLFFHSTSPHWVLHADSNGLWPLCGHIQPSALQCEDAQVHLHKLDSSRPSWLFVWTFVDQMSSTISTLLTHHSLSLLGLKLMSKSFICSYQQASTSATAHHHPVSYAFILAVILRIKSAEGRHKAFSTCGSHVTIVTLYYGAIFCTYLRSPTDKNAEGSKIIAVFYTLVRPVLNPLIDSLWNNNVKQALKRIPKKYGHSDSNTSNFQ